MTNQANQFDKSGNGDQNIGQGNHAPSTSRSWAQPSRHLFCTLLKHNVPRDQWDAKLREIAAIHKELLARLATVQSEDPEVQRFKGEARQAIEAGEYGRAEELLHQAEALDLAAIKELEQAAQQQRLSAAATNVDQAKLQEVQLRYAKAAEYWQKAAALLPKGEKKNKAYYLNAAGEDLYHIARYREASSLFEQSLTISQEIGDRAGEGTSLNSIAGIHYARGEYDKALPLYKQSLAINREVGNRAMEGTALNNISLIYKVQDKYYQDLSYLEMSLALRQEIGDRAEEGTALNNISQFYDARGEYDKALSYLEQSLAISYEIGDRQGEAETSWNIGRIYEDQGDLTKAEQYMARAMQLAEKIGPPSLEKYRKALERVRAAIKGQ